VLLSFSFYFFILKILIYFYAFEKSCKHTIKPNPFKQFNFTNMKKYSFALILVLALYSELFNPVKLSAQTRAADTLARLKPFVGKFQFKDNAMAFLQIMLQDGHLVLKQLWDQKEIPFKQTADLEFYNDEDHFPLKFTKSSTGDITQVLAFNRDIWNRVADDYTPPLKKIIKLTDEQLKTFEGKYELKDGDGDADDIAQVTSADGHLVIKHVQDVSNLLAVSELDFVTEDQTFTVKFSKAADGSVTQAVVNNKDVWLKAK
jgi:hypothetical protein